MSAFIANIGDIGQNELLLRGDEAHHVAVRRYTIGDRIDVIDGEGGYYHVCIHKIEHAVVRGLIMEREADRGESHVRLHLAAAVMKGNQRFDYVVEKATEVGVASIRPLLTDRTVVAKNQRRKRWQRLASEAAKQCGRSRVPAVAEPVPFDQALQGMLVDCQWVAMASPAWDGRGVAFACPPASLVAGLMVGPEGGFSESEQQAALSAGVLCFNWGERTLRSDTAAVVLSALVLERVMSLASEGYRQEG